MKPTRPRHTVGSIVSGSTGINWDAYLVKPPRLRGYEITPVTDVPRNGASRLYLVDGKQSEIEYFGVDSRGRNLGIQAWIKRVRGSRSRDIREPANGDFPYLKGTPPGIYRGHLLAGSLNGLHTLINWIPLKGKRNLAEWSLVEKDIFEHIDPYKSRWAFVRIEPVYQYHIPIPSIVVYEYTLYEGETARPARKRRLNNHLEHDEISERLKNAWE